MSLTVRTHEITAPIRFGFAGEDGADGPNEVTTDTATDITGILKGNGSTVEQAVSGTDYEPAKSADDNFVTDSDKAKLDAITGTNTGDQDLSDYVQIAQVTGVYILVGDWSLIGDYYEADISNGSITADSVVDVIPVNASVTIVKAAEILPETESETGSVKIYSTNLPTDSIGVTLNIFD